MLLIDLSIVIENFQTLAVLNKAFLKKSFLKALLLMFKAYTTVHIEK